MTGRIRDKEGHADGVAAIWYTMAGCSPAKRPDLAPKMAESIVFHGPTTETLSIRILEVRRRLSWNHIDAC